MRESEAATWDAVVTAGNAIVGRLVSPKLLSVWLPLGTKKPKSLTGGILYLRFGPTAGRVILILRYRAIRYTLSVLSVACRFGVVRCESALQALRHTFSNFMPSPFPVELLRLCFLDIYDLWCVQIRSIFRFRLRSRSCKITICERRPPLLPIDRDIGSILLMMCVDT